MRGRIVGYVMAGMLLMAGYHTAAASAYLPSRVSLAEVDGKYVLSVSYQGVFPLKVLSAIEDGMRVQVVCEVVIRRQADFALSRDEEVYLAEYVRSIQYNLMDGRYLVVNLNTGARQRIARRSQLLAMLRSPEDLPVIGNAVFSRRGQYYAEARIAIRFGKLYPPFSFFSIMTYESPWVRSGVLQR